MLNFRSAHTDVNFRGTDLNAAANDAAIQEAFAHSTIRLETKRKGSRGEWLRSLAAVSIAMLIVAVYASVCFHWGGPRVTLLLISLVASLWLFSVQRSWQNSV